MDARSRRKLGMGASASTFSRGRPDPSPGYEAALSGVEERLARADVALADQRSGLLGVHTNAIRKQELRSTMRDAHLKWRRLRAARHRRSRSCSCSGRAPAPTSRPDHGARVPDGSRNPPGAAGTAWAGGERADGAAAVARSVRRRDGERVGGPGRAREGQCGDPAAGGRSGPGSEGAGSLQPGAVPGDAGSVGGVAECQQRGRAAGEDRAGRWGRVGGCPAGWGRSFGRRHEGYDSRRRRVPSVH
jgi:hypothetical protein